MKFIGMAQGLAGQIGGLFVLRPLVLQAGNRLSMEEQSAVYWQAMKPSPRDRPADNLIRLSGIVERVTFHNAENGWSVLKVSPFNESHKLVTVVIHQARVFAGSSMDFYGTWTHHPQHGEQFKAERAVEKKPATSAAAAGDGSP